MFNQLLIFTVECWHLKARKQKKLDLRNTCMWICISFFCLFFPNCRFIFSYFRNNSITDKTDLIRRVFVAVCTQTLATVEVRSHLLLDLRPLPLYISFIRTHLLIFFFLVPLCKHEAARPVYIHSEQLHGFYSDQTRASEYFARGSVKRWAAHDSTKQLNTKLQSTKEVRFHPRACLHTFYLHI